MLARAETRSLTPSDHTYEEERTQWKWYEAFNLHSAPETCDLQGGCITSTLPNSATSGNQVFKCQSLQGAFLLQTTTGTIIFALRPICCLSELGPRPPLPDFMVLFFLPKTVFLFDVFRLCHVAQSHVTTPESLLLCYAKSFIPFFSQSPTYRLTQGSPVLAQRPRHCLII